MSDMMLLRTVLRGWGYCSLSADDKTETHLSIQQKYIGFLLCLRYPARGSEVNQGMLYPPALSLEGARYKTTN